MVVDAHPPVLHRPSAPGEPRGDWFIPRQHTSPLTLLYFHGGGYAFYGAVSRHFIAMLAEWLRVPIFAPDYRLTPEHPHPAQIDDGLAAYRFLLGTGVAPSRLIVGGDSAGGHLALMLLARLTSFDLPQPALTVGLSPWTDIGRRGASQFDAKAASALMVRTVPPAARMSAMAPRSTSLEAIRRRVPSRRPSPLIRKASSSRSSKCPRAASRRASRTAS